MTRVLAIAACVAAACATAGTSGSEPDDATPTRDAPSSRDAPVVQHMDAGLDAFVMHDAPPDSAGSGGQFCSVNADCTDPGTCCFIAICTPGTGIGSDLCFPSN